MLILHKGLLRSGFTTHHACYLVLSTSRIEWYAWWVIYPRESCCSLHLHLQSFKRITGDLTIFGRTADLRGSSKIEWASRDESNTTVENIDSWSLSQLHCSLAKLSRMHAETLGVEVSVWWRRCKSYRLSKKTPNGNPRLDERKVFTFSIPTCSQLLVPASHQASQNNHNIREKLRETNDASFHGNLLGSSLRCPSFCQHQRIRSSWTHQHQL